MTVNYNVTEHLGGVPELTWSSLSCAGGLSVGLGLKHTGIEVLTAHSYLPWGSFFSKGHFLAKLLMSDRLKIITIKDSNGLISFLKKVSVSRCTGERFYILLCDFKSVVSVLP